jgi:hypothetical protein
MIILPFSNGLGLPVPGASSILAPIEGLQQTGLVLAKRTLIQKLLLKPE